MKVKLLTCAAAMAILLGSQQAYAGWYEDANAAYLRGDYSAALTLVKPIAEQGDAAGENFLGVLYSRGRGVPQDYTEAIKWYRKAAEQGNAKGQANLGAMYYQGQSVPHDYTEASKWYRKAAEQGGANGR